MKIIVEEKTIIIPPDHKIKSAGMFDLKELYLEVYRWFTHNGYAWKETKYRNAEQPNGVKLIEIWWKGIKKKEDYMTFVIEMNMQAFVTDAEGTREGAKVKLSKGTVEFRSGAYIEKNMEMWGKKPGGLLWAKLYEIMIRDRIEKYKEELYIEAHKLFNEVKTYLELYK